MSIQIEKITLIDLPEKLGKHEYEIVDVSTEWCGPCKMMKNAMKKIFKSKDFKEVDMKVYVLDGDECSMIPQKLELINFSEKEGFTFPIALKDFKKCLDKAINSEGDYTKEDMERILESVIDGEIFEGEDGIVRLSEKADQYKNIQNPYVDFEVEGFPTLIFYHKGNPITNPLVEEDYESRGFYHYDEKFEELEGKTILEIEHEGELKKIVQINKKLDARIVGFDKDNLKKSLQKFISLK